VTGAERESYIVAVAFIAAAALYWRVRRMIEKSLDERDAASGGDEPDGEDDER